MNTIWTKEKVISLIQTYHANKHPLNFKYINKSNKMLRQRAEKFFGSWGNAVIAAGFDYDEIKKNKGVGESFLSEDGVLYSSFVEGLVANQLYKLKDSGRIIEYETQQLISYGKKWTCDFLITLLNGSTLILELEGSGENKRSPEVLKEKLDYYNRTNRFYYKLTTPDNLNNIIERLNSWYSIPIKNCIITGHKNPDGDSLSSSIALYKYIISNGKKAVIRVSGDIPRNLVWMIEGINIVKKIPDWAEMLIVVDCAPIKDRVGWDIPNVPVYNIDHHSSRFEENDPDNNIHVISSCSTASLLFSRFGVRDNILSVGVYTDTTFTRQIYEVLNFLDSIGIEEKELNDYISRVNSSQDRKVWDILQEVKTRRCRNGFLIAELENTYNPDIIENLMQVLIKLNESVCLIYGKDKLVKLRTSNNNIDLSKLAGEYGGGGHSFASVCQIENKVSEFKQKITNIDIQKEEDNVLECKN